MKLRFNSDTGTVTIEGAGALTEKYVEEQCKAHSPEFLQQWMKFELAAALRKEAA